nr:Chain A, NONO-1 [Caenorhabditis elegans]5CA5_B Chain B, NONO-1 [Caenorhabditis elegans]
GAAFTESQLMDEVPKKKFTGRCRLFVGNLPNEVKETELKELFSPHGDIAECYLSGKGFAFLRLDTRAHAESAKEAIDGRIIHGRQVRVRFAVHGAAIRVKELSPTVSNEMLYHAFSHFGDVERAVHIVDEKGRPTGEGIVEFERKPNCNEAMAAIRDKVFLLTASPKPLICEVLEPRDEDDGLAERMIPRTPGLSKERELGPRFPTPNSFEYVYGMKWKELYVVEQKRRAQLDEELRESRRRLESDMELAYQDYQAQML